LLLVLGLLGFGVHHALTVADRPQTLAGIDPADLRLIAIERTGEPRIQLERTPDGWQMREPLVVDADPGRIDQLLGILAAPVQRSFPASSAALAELGLEPVKLTLRLDGLTLGFGGLDPVEQRRYVAADGLVHLIDDRFQHLLIAPPIDWCAHALLPHGAPPVFATLNGVPLAAKSLKTLIGLSAERVEPLTGDLAGEPVQFKFPGGAALRFLVSEDRRRWSRPDLKLRYVLSDGMLLELDPTAVDPTPPAPPPPAPIPQPRSTAAAPRTGPPGPGTTPGRGPALEAGASDPFAPRSDPDAPLPADAPPGEPPRVHLSPDDTRPGDEDGGGFGAEPYKQPPVGFGFDPFAPPESEPKPKPGAGQAVIEPATEPAPGPLPTVHLKPPPSPRRH
jgi:hypothetical protein